MSIQHYFSENYSAAREKFKAACKLNGAPVRSYAHPELDNTETPLSTEVAWFGPRSAERLLVLVSGVHGVEALPGAACQTGLVAGGHLQDLPADTAVLMVHIINCWGAVHLRRNTEGNVDLCRNFLDFSRPLPIRPEYDSIHALVNCADRTGPRRDAAAAEIAAFVRDKGMDAYIQALMGGQYQHPDGFSFGGTQPVWAHRTLNTILAEYGQQAREVCVVEFHTGLGPWAYGTAVTMHTADDCMRARQWFGPWTVTPNQREKGALADSYRVHGHTTEGYLRALPRAEVTAIVLEYGTYPPQDSLPVMLEDHWLTLHGDETIEAGREIKQRMLRLHYPQDPDWRQAVWDRSQQVVAQAFRGLTAA
jgi:hypothetical protein